MILGIFKSNNPFLYLLFPVLIALLWLRKFINTATFPFFESESKNLLYNPIDKILTGYPFGELILAVVLVIIIAILVQFISNNYGFLKVRTMLPGSLFIILLGGFPQMHYLHPVYFAAIFFNLAIFRLFSMFDQVKPYSAAFDSGFLFSFGILFYFNIIIMFPVILIGINILSRDQRWREFVICLLGFLLPVAAGIGITFATGKFDSLLYIWNQNFLGSNSFFKPDLIQYGFIGLLGLIIILASSALIRQYDSLKVNSRKFFVVFFLVFLFTVSAFFLIPGVSKEIFVITLIPVSYLVSNFFIFMKSNIWDELIFTAFLGLIIALQIVPYF